MNISIIGTGNIGKILARRFTEHGHSVRITNSRGAASLADFATEIGAQACDIDQVVDDADVIVVTIPQLNVPQLPKGLFDRAKTSAIVIDTGNYYPRERDGKIAEIEAGLLESVWVENHLRHPVIKAFNNIYATHLDQLATAPGAANRIALPVSGDNPQAKQVVFDLVSEVGFDAVDTGPLSESWRQQPGTPVYTADLDIAGTQAALAQASQARTAQWTATAASPGTFEQPA
jgi:predicted dinucleotide-binding enzyme